jgi:hypothetical protein
MGLIFIGPCLENLKGFPETTKLRLLQNKHKIKIPKIKKTKNLYEVIFSNYMTLVLALILQNLLHNRKYVIFIIAFGHD